MVVKIDGLVSVGNELDGVHIAGKPTDVSVKRAFVAGNGGHGVYVEEEAHSEHTAPWYQRPLGIVLLGVLASAIVAVAVWLIS